MHREQRGAVRDLPAVRRAPGSGDHHSVEFMPGFVHAGNDYGNGVARAPLRHREAHRPTPRPTSRTTSRSATPTTCTRMPSGELVATLLDGMVTGQARDASRQPAERGQRDEPARRRGRRDHGHRRRGGCTRPRHARPCPAIMGEFLRRINVVQEWTVEAALTGDRDARARSDAGRPDRAAQLAYDDVVAMTDEMLAATARWLPQFAQHWSGTHGTADRRSSAAAASSGCRSCSVDIVNTPSLAEAEIVLEDIDPAPLHRHGRLRRATSSDSRASGMTVDDDHRSARRARRRRLRGRHASRPAAFESMRHDLEIPERHGIKQSVGDTVGPGGIMRALRNIPVLVGIARDMEEVCPDAWMLNITNPMTTLCRAVTRETDVKTVGLCHEITMRAVHAVAAARRRLPRLRLRRRSASTTCRSSPRCASTATTASTACASCSPTRDAGRRADPPAPTGSATSIDELRRQFTQARPRRAATG